MNLSDREVRTFGLMMFLGAAMYCLLEIGWLASAMRYRLVPQIRAVVQKSSATLDKSNVALESWQQQGAEELRETRKATADLHDLLIHTDVNLNGRHGDGGILGDFHATILPRVGRTLDAGTDAIRNFDDGSGRVLRSTDSSVAKIEPLIVALTDRVNDPRYDSILANAAASVQNLSAMTASGAHAMKTTDDVISKEAQIILAPVSKIKTVALFVLQAAGRFLGY